MMKGFTLIEMILVVTLITTISALSTPMVSSYILRSGWHTASSRVASEIYKAQSYAMSGKDNGVWGVCITGSIFRLFRGSCAAPAMKEDYDIPVGVSVAGISSLTFGNLRGEPNVASTITVSCAYGTTTITVNAAGMVQVN